MVRLLIAGVLVFLLCGSSASKVGSKTTRTQAISRTIHVDPPQIGESRYHYVPFPVLPDTNKISISYNYDHANGSNALDIGLFDSRSSEQVGDVNGFRGWSGGRRAEFFVSRDSATPGYIPGELRSGTWRIILGLYRIEPGGVDVTLKIDEEIDEGKTANLATPAEASQVSMGIPVSLSSSVAVRDQAALAALKEPKVLPRWISGDLHLHTVHSDGDWSIAELVAAAKTAGLDFICITDHNTYSHHAEMERINDLLVLRGEEITTYGGHANAWGLPRNALIDFRIQPGIQESMSRLVSQAHDRGALISINHPFAPCPGCDWSYGQNATWFDAVEVWNGTWDSADERALSWWDSLLQNGRRITAIASSDSHRPANPVGQPTTHLEIDRSLTAAGVLQSIRAGRAYLTSTASAPAISFTAQSVADHRAYGIGDVIDLPKPSRLRFNFVVNGLSRPVRLSLISQGKAIRTVQAEPDSQPEYVELVAEQQSYFRVEVRELNGTMLALTNPIYVETKKRKPSR